MEEEDTGEEEDIIPEEEHQERNTPDAKEEKRKAKEEKKKAKEEKKKAKEEKRAKERAKKEIKEAKEKKGTTMEQQKKETAQTKSTSQGIHTSTARAPGTGTGARKVEQETGTAGAKARTSTGGTGVILITNAARAGTGTGEAKPKTQAGKAGMMEEPETGIRTSTTPARSSQGETKSAGKRKENGKRGKNAKDKTQDPDSSSTDSSSSDETDPDTDNQSGAEENGTATIVTATATTTTLPLTTTRPPQPTVSRFIADYLDPPQDPRDRHIEDGTELEDDGESTGQYMAMVVTDSGSGANKEARRKEEQLLQSDPSNMITSAWHNMSAKGIKYRQSELPNAENDVIFKKLVQGTEKRINPLTMAISPDHRAAMQIRMKGIRSKMPLIKSIPKALNGSKLEEERVDSEKGNNANFNLYSAIYQANSDGDKQMVAYYAMDGMCLTAQNSGDSLAKRFGEKWGSQLLFQRRQAASTPSTDQVEGMVIATAKEQRARESFLSKRGPGQPAATPTPEDDSSYTSTNSSRAGGYSTAATQPRWQSAWNTTTNDGGQHQQSGGSFQSSWFPEGSRGGRGRGRARSRSRGSFRGALYGQGRGGAWRGGGFSGPRGNRGGLSQAQQQQQQGQQQPLLQVPQANGF
jgi:hypothetical protein